MAGMTAALNLANQNFEVFLAEKSDTLGGNLRQVLHTVDGLDTQALLNETIERVTSHPLIHVATGADAVDHTGFKGNFETGFVIGPEKEYRKIAHGIIVLADQSGLIHLRWMTAIGNIKPMQQKGHYCRVFYTWARLWEHS